MDRELAALKIYGSEQMQASKYKIVRAPVPSQWDSLRGRRIDQQYHGFSVTLIRCGSGISRMLLRDKPLTLSL
jgi:hypothetical protein